MAQLEPWRSNSASDTWVGCMCQKTAPEDSQSKVLRTHTLLSSTVKSPVHWLWSRFCTRTRNCFSWCQGHSCLKDQSVPSNTLDRLPAEVSWKPQVDNIHYAKTKIILQHLPSKRSQAGERDNPPQPNEMVSRHPRPQLCLFPPQAPPILTWAPASLYPPSAQRHKRDISTGPDCHAQTDALLQMFLQTYLGTRISLWTGICLSLSTTTGAFTWTAYALREICQLL